VSERCCQAKHSVRFIAILPGDRDIARRENSARISRRSRRSPVQGRNRTTDTRIFSPINRRLSPQKYAGNSSHSVIEASIDYAGKLTLRTQHGIRAGEWSASASEDRPSILGALRHDSTVLPDVERRPVHSRSASRRFLGTHQRSLDSSGEPWISVQVLSDGLALHGLRARHSNPLRSTRGYARDLAVARQLPRP
jgi:hypothetical protein